MLLDFCYFRMFRTDSRKYQARKEKNRRFDKIGLACVRYKAHQDESTRRLPAGGLGRIRAGENDRVSVILWNYRPLTPWWKNKQMYPTGLLVFIIQSTTKMRLNNARCMRWYEVRSAHNWFLRGRDQTKCNDKMYTHEPHRTGSKPVFFFL